MQQGCRQGWIQHLGLPVQCSFEKTRAFPLPSVGPLNEPQKCAVQGWGSRIAFPLPLAALVVEDDVLACLLCQQESMPFAVVGSDKEYQVNGKRVLGRKTPWGIIEGNSTHLFEELAAG